MLNTPLTPEDQLVVDRAILQQAFKQGFTMVGNAIGAVNNTIAGIEKQAHAGSEDLIAEAKMVIQPLATKVEEAKALLG